MQFCHDFAASSEFSWVLKYNAEMAARVPSLTEMFLEEKNIVKLEIVSTCHTCAPAVLWLSAVQRRERLIRG